MGRSTLCSLLLLSMACAAWGTRFQCDQGKLNNDQSASDACDGQKYVRSVLTGGGVIVPIIIIVLMIITFLFFCFGRCCNCCGGRKNRTGVCCVDGEGPDKYYAKYEVYLTKGLVIIALILAIIAIIVAGAMRAKISEGAHAPIDTIKASAARVSDIFTQIIDGVDKSITSFTNIESKLNDASVRDILKTARDARGTLVDARKTIDEINNPSTSSGDRVKSADDQAEMVQKRIFNAVIALVVVPLVFILVVTIMGMLNLPDTQHRWPFYICIVLANFIAWLIWVLVVILTVIHIVVVDFHEELEGSNRIYSDTHVKQNYPIMNLLRKGCRDNLQSNFDKINDQSSQFDRIASDQFCKQLNSTNQGTCGVFSCCTGIARQKCPNLKCPSSGLTGRHAFTLSTESIKPLELDIDRRYVDSAVAALVKFYALDVEMPTWQEYLYQPRKTQFRALGVAVPPAYAPSTTIPPGSPPSYAYLQNLTNQNLTFPEIVKVVGNLSLPDEISSKYNCPSPCTLNKCATLCNDTTIRNTASIAVDMAGGTEALYNVAQDVILPLLNCPIIVDKLVYPARGDMKKVVVAVKGLLDAMVLIGVALILMIIAAILGIKRFTKKYIKGAVVDSGKGGKMEMQVVKDSPQEAIP